MAVVNDLRATAKDLREFAGQIRSNNEAVPYPTADLDALRLEKAATQLEEAADELERLRKTGA